MPSLFHPSFIALNGLTIKEIPVGYTTGLLAGAGARYFTAAWGSLILQELVINGFVFGYNIVRATEPVALSFICDEASAILHYVLEGTLIMNTIDAVPITQLKEQECAVGCHPSGSALSVCFSPGDHHYFQLAFSPYFFHRLIQSTTALSWFFTEPSATSAVLFHPYRIPVAKNAMQLIHTLLADGNEKGVLFQNNAALRLTARFVIDMNAFHKKAFWEQKKILKLEELENYILDHLDTDSKKLITLSACAKKTGTTTYKFKQLFSGQYRQSLFRFIRTKKMEKAMNFIRFSQLPAGEIYLQVGFEDFSSFSRAFHAYFGHPPSHYKKDDEPSS